jgi:RNA 2',3'-cyclic 3'-phosphodiesterase
MAPESMRLFVALPVPANIRAGIAKFARELDTQIPAEAVRWTPEEQIHLTLKFLGKVDAVALHELQQALGSATLGIGKIELQARHLGAFPSLRNPRVIWIGLEGNVESLLRLQQQVSEATAPWCEKEEDRKFSPHLTIGRLREPQSRAQRKISVALQAKQSPRFGNWQADEICLMRSQLSPHGATHTAVGTYLLSTSEPA